VTASAIGRSILNGLGIDAPMTTRQWAERYRVVKGGPVADRSGGSVRWRTDIVPHTAGIMDAIDDDDYDRIVVEGPTRLAKSEAAIINPILKRLHEGRSALYINQSKDDCVKCWQDKFLPAIQATPELAKWEPGDKEGGQMMHRIFRNGAVLYMSGAGMIPAGFDASFACCDEVNKPGYDRKRGQEVDTVNLAGERADGYEHGRKLVMVCTVTEPTGRITTAYLSGDRRLYYSPCPYCGGYQVMEFTAGHAGFGTDESYPNWEYPHGCLAFDDESPVSARKSAVYVCGLCGETIPEKHKTWMARAGLWVPKGCAVELETVKTRKRHPAGTVERPVPKGSAARRFIPHLVGSPETATTRASFHFNAMVSLITSWGRLAQSFVEARDNEDPDALRSFQRSRLTIPGGEKEQLDQRAWDTKFIRQHATPYYSRTLPDGCPATMALMTADVHKAVIYYIFRAWAPDATSWLLEAGVIGVHHMKDSDDTATRLALWNALDRLWEAYEEGFALPDGKRLLPERGFLDEGWETELVREYCRDRSRRGSWFPVKGMSGLTRPWYERQKEYAGTFNIAVDRCKHQLARLMEIGRRFEDGQEIAPAGYWHLHADPPHDYCHQLCSEEWRPKKNKDGTDSSEYEWGLRKGNSNHDFDCETYQIALAMSKKIPVHRIGRGLTGKPSAPRSDMGEPRRATAKDYEKGGAYRIGRGGRETGGRDDYKIGR